jgi:hypothetical protein
MRPLLGVLPLVALAACEGLGVGGSVDVETVPAVPIHDGEAYSYSAKFLCGTIAAEPGSPEFPDASRDTNAVLVPGTYLTSINVYNPEPMTVVFEKGAVPIRSQFARRGARGEFVDDTLHAYQGFYVACAEIFRHLTRDPQSLRDSLLEGFVAIRSRTQLQVTAVYSFKNVDGRSR